MSPAGTLVALVHASVYSDILIHVFLLLSSYTQTPFPVVFEVEISDLFCFFFPHTR